jgi:hypothetical protein
MLLAGVTGCGGVPYKTVPVSGKIAYDDGSPIKAASIELFFWPQVQAIDTKTKPRQGAAEVDPADGSFSVVSTWQYGDGAIVGKHKVCVFAKDEKGNLTKAVPQIYRDPKTTPLEVEVSKGMAPLPLTIKKK